MKNVESFFFGEANLFGMYHSASNPRKRHAVIVVAPLFHEYYISHFALKTISIGLASKGYDVLRFDYAGWGDSAGELPSSIFQSWSSNVKVAADYLSKTFDCRAVSCFATRFATALVAPYLGNLDRGIFWDPVVDDRSYLEDLEFVNKKSLLKHRNVSDQELEQAREIDFLGLGLNRQHMVSQMLSYCNLLDTDFNNTVAIHSSDYTGPAPGTRIVQVASSSDWRSARTGMFYAHDVIKGVIDAFD